MAPPIVRMPLAEIHRRRMEAYAYGDFEGEAMRDDENFAFVGAWEYKGVGQHELHKEDLSFEHCKPTKRSYK